MGKSHLTLTLTLSLSLSLPLPLPLNVTLPLTRMGESQLFISFLPSGVNEPREPAGAVQAAELVAEIAPYVGWT